MSATAIHALCGIALVALAARGLALHESFLRKVLAVNVMGSGIFMVLISLVRRREDQPPDPVPQAMVLTGIVVAASATALALRLARTVAEQTGHARLPQDEAG